MTRAGDNLQSAALIEVVRVSSREGTGTDEDPVRIVTTYFDPDGSVLAIWDPVDPVKR